MNIFIKLAAATALVVCMTAPAFATPTPKEDSVVTQGQITLGDVFDGVTADAGHYLAPAPEPGKTVTLGTYDLIRISKAFNLGWAPSGDGAHVVIRRGGGEIDRFDIQAALEQKMKEEMKGQRLAMELSDRSASLHVPETADKTINVEKLTYDAADSTFKAVVSAAAEPDAKKEVGGHYYIINRIPVLKSPLIPGDVISASDIDYIDMRSSDITSSMVTEASDLVGQTPRRGINAMKPVTAGDIHLPVIVRKGDLVTMVLKNNALSLTTQGRAMDSGAAGDAIRVMNSSSKQVVDAVVTGSQTVSIKPPLGTL